VRRTLVSCCLLLALPAAAHATTPGRNGSIFFEQIDTGPRGETSRTSIRALDPRTRRVRILEDWSFHGGASGPNGPDRFLGPPGLSQDGSEVAFSSMERLGSDPAALERYVNIVGAQGSGFRKLPTGRLMWGGPAWLPGSDALVVDGAIGSPSDYGLFRFTRDGEESGPLVAPGHAPDVSRRGDIAYGNGGIKVLSAGATVPRRVTRRGAKPSWSPNARWLAFERATGRQRTDVFVVRSDGRRLRRLTRRGGQDPTWSPDGRSIAFVRADGDLFVVKAAGGRSRRLLNLPGFEVDGFGEGIGAEAPAWQALPRP
jgi:hypothetical protein